MGLLSLGSNGIAAQNSGIAVASNNVANANTEGYSRQRVDLEALMGTPMVGGVRSNGADRLSDALLGGRIRVANGALQMSTSQSASFDDLQSRLTDGTSLSDQLASMYASFSQASSSPTDSISRADVIQNVQDMSANVRRKASELAQMYDEFNSTIRDKVAQASDLAQKLAETNLQIQKTNDPVAKDQRDKIAKELSGIVGGSAHFAADGSMRFVLDGGAVLVDGNHAAKLGTSTDPASGDTTVQVVDGNTKRDVTKDIHGGTVGSDLSVRDGTLKTARKDLDQFAFDLAGKANAIHKTSAGLDGSTGNNLFEDPGTVDGAASRLAINSDIVDDPNKLALGAVGGGAGSNAGALSMYQLANQKVATGGVTLGESALGVIGKVGRAAATAKSDLDRDTLVSDHLSSLQDSLAGVDIQEEMTNLTKFEHASSAMTKFTSTVDSLLSDMIEKL
ncbi:MAG TPA: flagellar hook-associated protein FlgK [Kofleriaceae bacterium]